MQDEQKFDEWCLVELMGHNRLAGRVTEQAVGGESFIRIDVPEVEGSRAFTKLFGKGAIYAMTPTTEEVVRNAVKRMQPAPVSRYEFPALPSEPTTIRQHCDEDEFGDEPY